MTAGHPVTELAVSLHSAIQQAADDAEGQKLRAEAAELTWRMQQAARQAQKNYYSENPSMKGKLSVHTDIGVSAKRDPVFRSLAGRLVRAWWDKPEYLDLTNTTTINQLSKNLGVKVAGNYLSKSPSKQQRTQVAGVLAKINLPAQWASLPLSKIKQHLRIRRILEQGGADVNVPLNLSTKHVVCFDKIYPVDKTGRVIVGRHRVSLNALLEMFNVFHGSDIPELKMGE